MAHPDHVTVFIPDATRTHGIVHETYKLPSVEFDKATDGTVERAAYRAISLAAQAMNGIDRKLVSTDRNGVAYLAKPVGPDLNPGYIWLPASYIGVQEIMEAFQGADTVRTLAVAANLALVLSGSGMEESQRRELIALANQQPDVE